MLLRRTAAGLLVGFGLLCATPAAAQAPPEKLPTAAPRPGFDLYGDPLPPGAVARFGTVRLRHGTWTQQVAFSADGKLLASLSDTDEVRLWDVSSGKLVRALECPSTPRVLAFAPRGSVLATGHTDTKIRLWDPATGRLLRTLSGHEGAVVALAFSPDGKTLASGGRDENYRSVEVGPRFYRQVSDDADRTVRLWDVSRGTLVRELAGHTKGVYRVMFVGDGSRLISGSDDGSLKMWDIARARPVPAFSAPRGTFKDFCLVTPKTLALVCSDQPALATEHTYLWDYESGEGVPQGKRMARATTLAADAAGRLLAAVSDDGIWLYRIGSSDRPRGLAGSDAGVVSMAFSGDGKLLAAATRGPTIRLWDTATRNELLLSSGHQQAAALARFLPDGRAVRSVGPDGRCCTWDAATGRVLREFSTPGSMGALDLSPDGRYLAVRGPEWRPEIWDADGGKKVGEMEANKDVGFSLVKSGRFSPDGKTLALAINPPQVMIMSGGRAHHTSDPSGTVVLLSVPGGREVRNLGKQDGAVDSLLYAPDGKSLVVTTGTVRVCDLAAPKAPPRLLVDKVTPHAFCQGGQYLLAAPSYNWLLRGDSGVRILRASTGKPFSSIDLDTHIDGRSCSTWPQALSPDGRMLAAAGSGREGTVQLREVPTGKKLADLRGHEGGVQTAAFSADGRYLLTTSGDGTVLVWDVAGRVREYLSRRGKFTTEELARCWQELGSENAGLAADARDRLVLAGGQSLRLLKEKLRPATEGAIAGLLADLDAKAFARRQQATQELERHEFAARPALEALLKAAPSLEAKRRAEGILSNLEQPMKEPTVLRSWRSVVVLEQLGGDEARALLRALARGSPHARLTQDARAALERWERWPR